MGYGARPKSFSTDNNLDHINDNYYNNYNDN